ncbi:MAG: hypothetical protein WBG95_03990, partial [Sulfitobacter sp.]
MYFERQKHHLTGTTEFDTDIRGLEVVELGSASFLLASTGVNGGLVSYRLDAAGTVAGIADTVLFSQDWGQSVSGMMAVTVTGNSASVVLGGGAGTAMVRYALATDGTIGVQTSTGVDTSSGSDAAAVMLAGGPVHYTVQHSTGQVTRHTADQGATVEQITVSGLTDLGAVTVGSATYLLVTSHETQSISSYRIDAATGALSHASDLGVQEGFGINAPTAFETVTAFGQMWVILGSAGSGTLSILEIAANGELRPIDQLLDTRDTRFDGVQDVATAQIGDRVFVVAGGADDGLSLFTLMPDGRLIHLETIPHTTGSGLMNVDEIETAVIGNALQIFVSSGTDAGITAFTVDLSNLGGVQRGDHDGSTTLQGTSGDDLLIAGQNDTVQAGAGNDILVGAAGAQLIGGQGADIFVLAQTGTLTRVLDFMPAVDTLDLSSFFMLRSTGQLEITSTSFGAQVEYRGTTIEVRSALGLSLDSDALFGAGLSGGFTWADRIPLPGSTEPAPAVNPTPDTPPPSPETPAPEPSNMQLSGGDGSDALIGGEGDDTLWGGSGH